MKLAILHDEIIYRIPRPPVFFAELQAIAFRIVPGRIEVDEDSDAYKAFKARWANYLPNNEDLCRAEAFTSSRSLAKRAVDVGRGVVSVAISVLGERTSDVYEAERIAACSKCPHFRRGGLWAADTCNICGCILTAKRKIRNARCPDVPARWVEEP